MRVASVTDRGLDAPRTIGAAMAWATARLQACDIESPRRDARLLVALAAGVDTTTVLAYPERPLDAASLARLRDLVARRAAREPVARLAGRRGFWRGEFRLTPATLDPRPDSETVIAATLGAIADRGARLRLLDLGTGTACLLLSLLGELPAAIGIGVDLDPRAAAVARANALAMGLESRAFFLAGWWGTALAGGSFDVVVANPPYVPTGAIAALDPEVARYDPWLALDGGPDGCRAFRELAPAIAGLLRHGGFAAIEVGAGQAAMAAEIFAASGLDESARHRDLAGRERCIVVKHRQQPNPTRRKKLLE